MKTARIGAFFVFVAVLAIHFALTDSARTASPWVKLDQEEAPSALTYYLTTGYLWLGLSYSLAVAFTLFCLFRLYLYRKRAVAGAVGGLTLIGFVSFAGCWLLGCCGSPMLAVYLSLFGSRFVGLGKPLTFVITFLSVTLGYVLVTRRKPAEFACSDPSCSDQAADLQQSLDAEKTRWITGSVQTPAGDVPKVATKLEFHDRLGTLKARLGINRMRYAIEPGLYAIGSPTSDSDVFVSANYKMSFDYLRSSLDGRDGWIMVLDTRGINVWCAAGKGTFGAEEIVRSIKATRLSDVVSHHEFILPQLAASGVAAREVRKRAGFKVLYGPVRARDLPAYLDAGRETTPEMRQVNFTFSDRLVLTPIEIMAFPKTTLAFLLGIFLLSGVTGARYSFKDSLSVGSTSVFLSLLGLLAGAVITPALLPWLPGRAFSIKGAFVGSIFALIWVAYRLSLFGESGLGLETAAWFLLLPTIASFFAMNFTGASTYTSFSGVVREMKYALPVQITGAIIGLGILIVDRLV